MNGYSGHRRHQGVDPGVEPMNEKLEPSVLNEVVRRIVAVAQPEKIILFGSAARGEMGPHSDIDLLIVKPNVHRRRLAQAIYLQMIGVGLGVDAIVATPEDLERYRDAPGSVIAPALREGRVIYER
jgi:uncharacterized protein